MATYTELYDIWTNSVLWNQVEVAVCVAADTIFDEDGGTANHAERMIWAREALVSPRSKALPMLKLLLADKKGLETSAILGATDLTIQTLVDAAVNSFAVI